MLLFSYVVLRASKFNNPAYNEADRIGDVIEPALDYLSEIIVVDDGSTDGTHKRLDYEVTVLRHSENRGRRSHANRLRKSKNLVVLLYYF